MAKAPQSPKPSSSGPSPIVLVVGGILVVALLAFSLSRSMRKAPATAPVADSSVQTSLPPPAAATASPTQPAGADSSAPPMASPRAGGPIPTGSVDPFDETGGATPVQLASVPRMKPVDLLQKLDAKQVTIIDVRDADSYKARHIPGALHIPLAYIAGEVQYLPKDKPIVTYCT